MRPLKTLSKIGVLPEDDENTINQKQFVVAEGILMSFGGLLWGTIVVILDKKLQSSIPYGYVVLTILNLQYFSNSKNFTFARDFQTTISLLLPFVFQASLGGFHASGGVMLWAMLAVMASLSYQNIRSSLIWLTLYLALTIIMGLLDYTFIEWIHPNTPSDISMILYTINIVVISAITFALLIFYVLKNKTIEAQRLVAEQQKLFKERFLANMSHEIRTPINAILGMTNLTLNSQVTKKQQQYLNGIKKSSENLLVIINDILDLSKLEAGKMTLEKIHFKIADMIQQVYFSAKLRADEKGLLFTWNIESDVPTVLLGDPYRLNQILINLIGNAIKFTPKGEVKILVEKELSGSIKFRIIDSGVGIPKEKIGMLFENFSQVDSSTTRKFGGTGLGLSISKTLIDIQNGNIEVKSEEGKGSEFSFSIPFELGNESSVEPDDVKSIDSSALDGIKILAAEDNEYNQIVLQDTLESLIKNVKIEFANNGKIAVEKLLANEYDIILMDIQMPIMDGVETTKFIRENMTGIKREIPILAITASILEKDTSRFLKAGMNYCIPKPFTNIELLSGLANFYKKPFFTTNTIELINNKIDFKEESITNLTFLKTFCEGDEKRMKKYIDMFLNGTPTNLKKIDEALIKQDYLGISRIAHTIKPQFNYMGMEKTKVLIDTIESYSASKVNLEQISLLVKQLNEMCNKSFKELKKEEINNH